ncbi:MAG: lysophospholipid acyltransferase family protein [Acidobacteriota bacterium]
MKAVIRWIAKQLLPPAAALLIVILRGTMRVQRVGIEQVERFREAGEPYIHAFWHGHLLLMPYSYVGPGIVILISAHQDGELIARTMRWFGHASARGSSTSGGVSALRAAVRALRGGSDVGITPDGPRGPRHVVQAGVIQAARMGGAPIVPVVFRASRCKVFSSWDRFIVPYPFSRGVFVYGEPVRVPRDAGPGEIEVLRALLERRLGELEDRARALVARRVVSAGTADPGHV